MLNFNYAGCAIDGHALSGMLRSQVVCVVLWVLLTPSGCLALDPCLDVGFEAQQRKAVFVGLQRAQRDAGGELRDTLVVQEAV